MSGEKTMFSIMVISFILIALVMIAVKKYTDKHKTLFNYTQIIVGFFVLLILGFILLIKSISKGEYENIVENVTLKTKVTSITFDIHKPYFKYMTLADGKYLPMPEEMNEKLKVNDSIYKNKGENFYNVVNAQKNIIRYEVKIHQRILTKSQ